ncbi:hypothetical protein M2271_003785 [Streptomyces sp. LBL]|nr:hypothetical protein [Streptomyces sp. LBL]
MTTTRILPLGTPTNKAIDLPPIRKRTHVH